MLFRSSKKNLILLFVNSTNKFFKKLTVNLTLNDDTTSWPNRYSEKSRQSEQLKLVSDAGRCLVYSGNSEEVNVAKVE